MLRKRVATLLCAATRQSKVTFYSRQSNVGFLYNSKMAFSRKDNKPPKGFEKFQRSSKPKADPEKPEEVKPEESKKFEANKDAEAKPPKPDPNEQKQANSNEGAQKEKKQENEENKNNDEEKKVEEKAENENDDSKKFIFRYKSKMFGLNEGKNRSKKKKAEEGSTEDNTDNSKKKEGSEKQKQSDPNRQKINMNNQGQNNSNENPKNFKNMLLIAIPSFLFIKIFWDYQADMNMLNYTDFIRNYLERDEVEHIKISRVIEGHQYKTVANVFLKNGTEKTLLIGNLDYFLENLEKFQLEKGRKPENLIPVDFEYKADRSKSIERVMNYIVFGATIFIFYTILTSFRRTLGSFGKGGGDLFGVGKSNAKMFNIESNVKTKFRDVAGLDEAKLEISEFVDFLKKPLKYQELGARLPRGALLNGPPGTGKTMLAKACAGEAEVPFFFISGSEFVEMFVGVGASRVRDLFKQAKEKSPSIIFIDEIDAVGRKRESKVGGNDERDNTLNQLLVEMDGFGTDTKVIVLAATNRKELLDNALTRPGRFDRTIEIDLPDIEGRKQIFKVHLKPLKLDPSKTIEELSNRLATLTPGFSGADIANLCNEAAIMAARKNKSFVETIDFEMASERVIAGLEKKRIISEEERKTIAVHESGHAVVSWFLEGGNPLIKLTIIPRSKGSLGFAQYLPSESSLETKQELLDRICCILGGRCAEEIFFGKITTGAYDDLKKAYDIAKSLVTRFGMSEKIGYIGFEETEYFKKHSEETQKVIDDEIKKIIDSCAQKSRETVNLHRAFIEKLSQALLEKESLDLKSIVEILGERPFAPKANFVKYMDSRKEIEDEIAEKRKQQAEVAEKTSEEKQETQKENKTSAAENEEEKK